jgi:hypothetical protein
MRVAKLIAVAAVALFTSLQGAASLSPACSEKGYFLVYDCMPDCPESMSPAQIAAQLRLPVSTVRACVKILKDREMVIPTATGGFCRTGA